MPYSQLRNATFISGAPVFSLMILKYLKKEVKEGGLLNEKQFGFHEGRSISQALFTANAAIEDSNQFNKPLHMLKLDVRKAFDSVDGKILIRTLRETQIPEKIVAMVESIYNDAMQLFQLLWGNPRRKLNWKEV